MARFAVHELGSGLVLDIQSNLLDGLHTRVVVPLIAEHDIKRAAERLNPRFEIAGTTFVMMTEFLAAVPAAELGAMVTSLARHADEITAATDFLFQGF
ncbi:CcdB family protein [Neorhizobium sp. NCHU2750]|uniref:CcdB family protein n=1 Tax=Neorhizobium sp. NCHU2750 TaxID=1825976 RepID=UPI000E755930|nr:toxin of the CcdB-CcdA toxin-antitoxin system [Neorhizobium sp. NCHU2750]